MTAPSLTLAQTATPTPSGKPLVPTRGVDKGLSSYLQYLPAPYQDDHFMGRFLLIAESIMAPIERTVDQGASYFDPSLVPEEMLPWLSSWVALDLDENWTLEQRRRLVAKAALLYRTRGTRRGLREHLQLFTETRPMVVENFDGMRLGEDSALGLNARLGQPKPFWVQVTVVAHDPSTVNQEALRRIIETEKPAHVGYTLEVVPRDEPGRTTIYRALEGGGEHWQTVALADLPRMLGDGGSAAESNAKAYDDLGSDLELAGRSGLSLEDEV